jgi:MFS family permease
MSLFTLASAIASRANSVGLFFGMRILQAFGSSAVLAIGAGTLADIFDPHERGTKVGIYYVGAWPSVDLSCRIQMMDLG